MKLTENFKISENFYINEFLDIKDKVAPTMFQISNITRVVKSAEIFRARIKRNMFVTSGIRSPLFNKLVKGDVDSNHLVGEAMDFEIGNWVNGKWVENYGDWKVESLLSIAELSGFGNIGFYIKNGAFQWIHADISKPREDGKYGWVKYSDTLSYKIHTLK